MPINFVEHAFNENLCISRS